MKKYLFIFGLSLLICSNAYALQCKTGQSLNSDECWTQVKIQSGYLEDLGLNQVSRGQVVVASIEGLTSTLNDGYLAQLSTASTESFVLGVAQQAIASGTSASVLAKGRGVILTTGATVTSKDTLSVTEGVTLSSRAGHAVVAPTTVSSNSTSVFWGRQRIATALENNSTQNSETESYIHVL